MARYFGRNHYCATKGRKLNFSTEKIHVNIIEPITKP